MNVDIKIEGNSSQETHIVTQNQESILRLYDKIRRSEQKHKVALEVLSYHAMCVDNEFKGLRNMPLPDPMPDIARYDFSPWGLDEEAKPLYVLCMFKDMFELNNPPPGHPDHQQRYSTREVEEIQSSKPSFLQFVWF
eukprot:XP_011664840.1 PREDICTED: probable 3',5'-cyclic phosphodiesterase pde-5 [Strongylocentrotus purpuratus]